MPLYEYQCKKCRHRFERIQKFSDPVLKKCPECGGVLERLLSAPAVQFKGSGWYVTDYARKGAAHPAAKAEEGAPAESSAAKTEEKPEHRPKPEHHKKHHDRGK